MSKSENPKQNFYDAPEAYLQQGDVFRVNIVGPSADKDARVFRTTDGRHGSAVFEEHCEARVFELGDLRELLQSTDARSELHTDPFHLTQDGQGEMVVVYARLFRYFVIASHTCDISDLERKALPWTTILPVFTLAEMCRTERLPFKSWKDPMSIQDFLVTNTRLASALESIAELDYATKIKAVVDEWIESGLRGKILEDARRIRNQLNNYHKKGIMFLLRGSEKFSIPESYVDFSAAFTIATEKLEAMKDLRFVRIAEPFRSAFSRAFGGLFSRLTLPP